MTQKNKIRISMIGACGRMGGRILSLAENDPRFQIVAGVEFPGSPQVGRLLEPSQAPVVGDIREVLSKTDVVIDFSAKDAVLKNAPHVAKAKRGLVIGTTGFSAKELAKIQALSRRAPIVLSPNMSMGVNVLFQLVSNAARILSDYDIEIVEAHHNQKKDAPSGTALKLAEVAALASGRSSKDFVYGRDGIVGARTKKEIGILAVRAGDIVGDHTVYLSCGGERLELTHRAHSRDALATGALKAAAWISRKKTGFFSMKDVLGL